MQCVRLVGLAELECLTNRLLRETSFFRWVVFFLRAFLFQPQTGTFCSWGGSAGTAAKAEQAVAALGRGAGTQNPTQIYSLTYSETLGPLLSSSHELSSRGC